MFGGCLLLPGSAGPGSMVDYTRYVVGVDMSDSDGRCGVPG